VLSWIHLFANVFIVPDESFAGIHIQGALPGQHPYKKTDAFYSVGFYTGRFYQIAALLSYKYV
jgi:hypothetical protein